MERPRWPKEHIGEYQTTDPSILHKTRPLLNLLTGWRSDGKISYWFDWQVKNVPKGFKGITLCGDPTASAIHSKLDELRMHFGMWEHLYIVQPKDQGIKEWQYGFLCPDKETHRMSVCSLILEGPAKVLIGSTPLTVIGLNPYNHQEISVQAWGMYNRHDCKKDGPLI